MLRWHLISALVLVAALLAATVYDAAMPGLRSVWGATLWLALFPAILASLIVAAVSWGTYRWRSFIPTLALLLVFPSMPHAIRLGVRIRDDRFRRTLPVFDSLAISVGQEAWSDRREVALDQLPPSARSCCTYAMAHRDSSGYRLLLFVDRTIAYRYDERPGVLPPYRRRLTDHWTTPTY